MNEDSKKLASIGELLEGVSKGNKRAKWEFELLAGPWVEKNAQHAFMRSVVAHRDAGRLLEDEGETLKLEELRDMFRGVAYDAFKQALQDAKGKNDLSLGDLHKSFYDKFGQLESAHNEYLNRPIYEGAIREDLRLTPGETSKLEASSLEAHMARKDLSRSMKRVLDTLPPKQREVLRMSYGEEKTAAEICQALKMTPDELKSIRTMAMQHLRGGRRANKLLPHINFASERGKRYERSPDRLAEHFSERFSEVKNKIECRLPMHEKDEVVLSRNRVADDVPLSKLSGYVQELRALIIHRPQRFYEAVQPKVIRAIAKRFQPDDIRTRREIYGLAAEARQIFDQYIEMGGEIKLSHGMHL